MKQANLMKRISGFASYERGLFQIPHVGWVEYTGNNNIRLRKSKFTDIYEQYEYHLPSDVKPPANAFVRIEINDQGKYKENRRSFQQYYEVEGYEIIDLFSLDLPKPQLYNHEKELLAFLEIKDELSYQNDFLNHLGCFWKGEHIDNLLLSLALLDMSCPPSAYGIGGTGSESFAGIGSTKEPINDIKRSITQMIPKDFMNQKTASEYHLMDHRKSYLAVERRRMVALNSEISYNYLYHPMPTKTRILPIQIAIINDSGVFTGQKMEYDQDIIDYILWTQLISPPVDDSLIKAFEKTIADVQKRRDLYNPDNYVDSYAIAKLSMAFSRLHFQNKLTDDLIYQASRYFRENYEEYIDAREKSLANTNQASWNTDFSKSDTKENLMPMDSKVFKIIRNASEELGIEWVPRSLIMERGGYKIE